MSSDLVDEFIADLDEFRERHCNPDQPEGWLPPDEWYPANHDALKKESAYHGALKMEPEVFDYFVGHVGWHMAETFSCLVHKHLQELGVCIECLLRPDKKKDEQLMRRLQNAFKDADWGRLCGEMRLAAGGAPPDATAATTRRAAPPTRSSRRFPKAIEMAGRAVKLTRLIESEMSDDTGRGIRDMLRSNQVLTALTVFKQSREFKDARQAWKSLNAQRDVRHDFAPSGCGQRHTCLSCKDTFAEYECSEYRALQTNSCPECHAETAHGVIQN